MWRYVLTSIITIETGQVATVAQVAGRAAGVSETTQHKAHPATLVRGGVNLKVPHANRKLMVLFL